jgi:DNA-binding cell septation regulator SpoVG
MKITRTQIFPVDASTTNLRGFAQVTIDDSLKLTGLKIFQNDQGSLHVQYPRNPKSKKALCYVFPIDPSLRDQIEDAVISEYNSL